MYVFLLVYYDYYKYIEERGSSDNLIINKIDLVCVKYYYIINIIYISCTDFSFMCCVNKLLKL